MTEKTNNNLLISLTYWNIIYFCTVKGIAKILVLYIFVLVMMPCFDNPYHQDEAMANIESVFDGTHSDLCSPFCSDHDCHTHITISFVNSVFVPDHYKAVNIELTTVLSTPFFAIWQPPKIG